MTYHQPSPNEPAQATVEAPDNQPITKPPPDTPETVDDVETVEFPKKEHSSIIKKFWWLIPALSLVLAVGGISFVRLRDKNSEEAVVTQPAPLTVRTVIAERGSIQAWISSEGTVQAVRFKHLAFDVDGDVTYVVNRDGRNLREGDLVRKGELLAKIDDRNLQADINQAEAAVNEAQRQRGAAAANIAQMKSQVAQARSQVAQARSQVAQAEAQRDQARAARNLAQTELQRYQQLFDRGAISASDIDNRRNTVQDAEAQVKAAQAQVETTQAQVSAAQAQVDTAQAQVVSAQEQLQATESQIATARARLEQAKVTLEGTRLYAPFDGVVAYLNIRENEYYSLQAVSSQLGNYQELLNRVPIVVIDPSQFEVMADLSATVGDRVRSGQTTLVTSNATQVSVQGSQSSDLTERAEARGDVYAVNPAVSPGNRSIQATARITSGAANLQHGESVTLWIAAAEKTDAVVVPLNAVAFRNQVPYVFVVNKKTNKVEQRQVELGIEGLNQREVLSGIDAGDLLVTEGQNGLVDGATVRVVQDDFTSSGGNNQ